MTDDEKKKEKEKFNKFNDYFKKAMDNLPDGFGVIIVPPVSEARYFFNKVDSFKFMGGVNYLLMKLVIDQEKMNQPIIKEVGH